jgi:hypothetical protein
MATQGITSGSRRPGSVVALVVVALLAASLAALTVEAASLWTARSHPAVTGGVALDGPGVRPMVFHGYRQPTVPIEYQGPRSRLTMRQIEAKKSGDGHH